MESESAIIVAVAAVVAALIGVFNKDIRDWVRRVLSGQTAVTQVGPTYSVKLYKTRRSSDEDMLSDIRRIRTAAFVGISQTNLKTYLSGMMEELKEDEGPLSIAVYYSSLRDGDSWEGRHFISNMRKSRLDISIFLTDPTNIKSGGRIERLSFWQCVHHSTYGGCVLKSDEECVIYIVNYLPSESLDIRGYLTLRVADNKTNEVWVREMVKTYYEAFEYMHERANSLGVFIPSLWDQSARSWHDFTSDCQAYKDSMRHLCDVAKFGGAERVLDVACGDGTTSQILHGSVGHLTVLDSSPQMLNGARSILGERASYALLSIPTTGSDPAIDLEHNNKFDAIVIHLAIPAVADSELALKTLAQWCCTLLTSEGKLILSVHNTAVRIEQSTHQVKSDPLRKVLGSIARSDAELKQHYRTKHYRQFTPTEIRDTIVNVGFTVKTEEVAEFSFTMKDRINMWRVPFVLDGLFDVECLSAIQIETVLGRAESMLLDQQTPAVVVQYWVFQAPSTQ